MRLKVLHISGDETGGAGKAAFRIHAALNKFTDVQSHLITPRNGFPFYKMNSFPMLTTSVARFFDNLPRRLFSLKDKNPRSSGWGSMLSSDKINASDADIVHLHWINNGFISLEEIDKINKPLVWTLHDVWPFSASEHIPIEPQSNTFHPNLSHDYYENIFDRWVFKRKAKLEKEIVFIAPSRWTKASFENSKLYPKCSVYILPNPLNTSVFRPRDKSVMRRKLALPREKKLILFGAVDPGAQRNKGLDLLIEAIHKLPTSSTELVIFGSTPKEKIEFGEMNVNYLGHIHEEAALSEIYSACDVMVIPSRIESFGQTASEAISSGCPVVCFDTSGLRDIIIDSYNGLLAPTYSSSSLSENIDKVLSNENLQNFLAENGRDYAVSKFDEKTVARGLEILYERILV